MLNYIYGQSNQASSLENFAMKPLPSSLKISPLFLDVFYNMICFSLLPKHIMPHSVLHRPGEPLGNLEGHKYLRMCCAYSAIYQ